MSVPGEARRLIETAKAGVTATPEDAQSLVDAVTRLAAMPQQERRAVGQRGYDYYMRELSMEKGMARFAEIFARVLEAHRR